MTTISGSQDEPRPKFLAKRLYAVFLDATERAGERQRVFADHLAFVHDLEARGILFAAGPFLDEATGKPNGSGMFLIRAGSAAEAAAIASEDPFQKHGFRTFRVQPWQINEGGFGLRVNFSAGSYALD